VPRKRAADGSLGDERRVCVYDRRNLGRSQTVDAPQLPADALADMRGLLAAADVKPPYVLLGAIPDRITRELRRVIAAAGE
jgi:hypothetical protein